MDSFHPQSSGMHVKAGHEEADFSLRGIILFIVILVLSAILTMFAVSGLMRFFEWYEKTQIDKKSTPAQQQLNDERGQLVKKEPGVKQPEWYDRAVDEKVLERTFATPRLQDDDEADMSTFLDSEKRRLESTGKDGDGSIHIPIDRAIDLLSDPKRGLPAVNGTFTPGPPLGALTDVSEAAQRRLNQTTAQEKKK